MKGLGPTLLFSYKMYLLAAVHLPSVSVGTLTVPIVPVKCLKEELIGLLNFKYFNGLSPPFTKYLDLLTSTCHSSKLGLLYT